MNWLHNSRIIATFAVVLFHVAAGYVFNSSIGSNTWWIGNVYLSLVHWCVPVFVMISGGLLLDPSKKEDLKTFYLKRLSRILVPMVFWSAFFLLWACMKGAIQGEPVGVLDLAKRLISGKPYGHMWFLYMIVFLYLFTPFLKKVISNSSRHEIAILVVTTLLIAAVNALALVGRVDSMIFINWFLMYIPYFLLGYLIRSGDIAYERYILWFTFLLSAFLTAFGCYLLSNIYGIAAGRYIYGNLSITVIPMSISVMLLMRKCTRPIGNEWLTKQLASLTLGVYLIHPVFLEAVKHVWRGHQAVNPAISVPLLSVVVYSLSLGTAWVISKVPYINKTI